jgi:uncharacterized membrane protein
VNRFSERVKKQKTIRPEAFSFLLFLFVVSVPNLKMWRKYEERENLVPYTLLLAAFGSYAKVVVVFFFFFTTPVLLWCVPLARGNGVGFFPWNFPKQKTNRAGPASTINDEILFLLHVHILSLADNRTYVHTPWPIHRKKMTCNGFKQLKKQNEKHSGKIGKFRRVYSTCFVLLPTAPISVSHTMKRLKQQKTTEMCLGICNTEKFTFSFIYFWVLFFYFRNCREPPTDNLERDMTR